MSLRLLMRIASLVCNYAAASDYAASDETCVLAGSTAEGALGQSMLQTNQKGTAPRRFGALHSHARNSGEKQAFSADQAPLPHCQLPPGATWCQVRLTNLPPYLMAVYDWNVNQDWVSWNICNQGFWEDADMAGFGAVGSMMDIGGNIGYHTFAFAQAGWDVLTFEPMAPNLAMINATMCQNPTLAAKIRLNNFGLGTSTQICQMMAPIDNVGDGFTKCGAPGETPTPAFKFKEIGSFNVRRLDEVLKEQNIAKVDAVKIDVEGYEYQVFAGAPQFLAQYKPRLIKSELWVSMVGSTGTGYLNMFEAAGYKFFQDSRCQVPVDAKYEVLKGGMDVVMCYASLPANLSAAQALDAIEANSSDSAK